MSNSRFIRNMAIVTITSMLAASNVWAAENEPNGLTMEFVRIPAGSFNMGSPSSEKDRVYNEGPVHEVRITRPFYMGKYEVTQAQWKAVMGTTVSQQRDKSVIPLNLKGKGPKHPIYYVSWEEAVEFCKRLGDDFRLPTEAEWEYACRAGTQTRFNYGDDPNHSELDEYAWFYDNSHNTTHPVGQKKPNAWGLYDMYGNVSEWCSDWFTFIDGYKNAGSVDPTGPSSTKSSSHVHRGGSWLEKPNECRSAYRSSFQDSGALDLIGFRIVYTGRGDTDKKVLELALPKELPKVANEQEQEDKIQLLVDQIITGVVRDDAGIPLDDAEVQIYPNKGWLLRNLAEGRFEAFLFSDKGANTSEYRLIARHIKQNLVAVVGFGEDVNSFDVKLKPGVILTGKVVDPDGKGIEEATVVMTKLQTSDWSGPYLRREKTDNEGRFEFSALLTGYDYVLSARKLHYLVGQTKVLSESMRDSHIDGISIVLPRGKFSISGLVVDAKGKPVPNALIYCTGKGQAGINSHTDAKGRFKTDGIFEGQVEVIANIKGDNGQWLSGSISTEAGATNVRIVLGTGGAPPPKGRACFPAGTNVWINGMLLPIDKVKQGQTCGKAGCLTSTAHFGQIEKIEVHEGKFECRDILLVSRNRISVVDKHCFMLDSGKWIAAQNLRSGLRLKTLNGTVVIKNVINRLEPFVGKVYNLRVKDSNQYMVGKDGVIVRDY